MCYRSDFIEALDIIIHWHALKEESFLFVIVLYLGKPVAEEVDQSDSILAN